MEKLLKGTPKGHKQQIQTEGHSMGQDLAPSKEKISQVETEIVIGRERGESGGAETESEPGKEGWNLEMKRSLKNVPASYNM